MLRINEICFCNNLLVDKLSSSENIALYWVITSNKWTRISSIVFEMWLKALAVGMLDKIDWSHMSLSCRNFTLSSDSPNTSIRRIIPMIFKHWLNWRFVFNWDSSCFSMRLSDSFTSSIMFFIIPIDDENFFSRRFT